jgi:predicted nucleotidyltransferase component of viral defense system
MESENMIDIDQLKEYAKIKRYNLGQAEKDYYQEIILFILYGEISNKLIFKGGTALTKCYGLNRFSEDLDFNVEEEKPFNKIIKKGMEKFYIEIIDEEKKHKDSIDITYWIKGPLYNGNKNSLCKISLDFSFREKTNHKITKQLGLHIEEIPIFNITAMSENEILAEKIRAIITRNKARDAYDTYNLILKGVKTTKEEINNKLKKHNKKISKSELENALNKKEKIWESELKPITQSFLEFNEMKNIILKWNNELI